MIEQQIIARGITHKATIEAMRKVRRHLLVPEKQRHLAYNDGPLPIGFGQTISQPYIVAFMTASVLPEKGHRILEIGTGSGYQSAVLAEIVDEVYTVEIIEELGKKAEKDLCGLGYRNIFFRIGDGYSGWMEHAPYDSVIVTAAAETVPPPLTSQLKEGGRMIIPVGKTHGVQQLVLIEKKDGRLHMEEVMPVRFVPFTRAE